MRKPISTRLVAVLLVSSMLGAGCADFSVPTSAPEGTPAPRVAGDAGEPGLFDLVEKVVSEVESLWTTVATETVLPGATARVEGSRYQLTFSPESLREIVTVTIQERDASIVDVELGPDGAVFDSPVTLTIDYAGTANDSRSPKYHGLPPQVFWWNPDMRSWVAIKGTDDPSTWTYTVELEHFSRYAMGDGTSGWENDPDGPESSRAAETVR